jgi:hypothetical protein
MRVGGALRHSFERLVQRPRVGIRIDQDERPPGVDRDRQQREAGRIERRLALRARSTPERPVELVGPSVVRTLQGLPAAGSLCNEMASVAADVHKAAQLPVTGSGHDDGDVACHRGEEAPGLRDLVRPPRVLPGGCEDALALELEEDRIRVPRGRQRPAFLERMIEGGRAVAGCEV